MNTEPVIIVQLVHIRGPLKGRIQEFGGPLITIGRNPTRDVRFPEDPAVSSDHAEIVREGNRFKLVDKSTNGTFVNGGQVKEVFLKDGDVVMFAPDGPKVSFFAKAVGRRDIEQNLNVVRPEPMIQADVPKPSGGGMTTSETLKKAVPETSGPADRGRETMRRKGHRSRPKRRKAAGQSRTPPRTGPPVS